MTLDIPATPHDSGAELNVLNALLDESMNGHEVFEVLSVDDFYDPAKQEAYQLIRDINEQGLPLSPVTFNDQAYAPSCKYKYAKTVDNLFGSSFGSMTINKDMARLKNATRLRIAHGMAVETFAAIGAGQDSRDVLNTAEKSLFKAESNEDQNRMKEAKSVIISTIEEIEHTVRQRESGEMIGSPTGLETMDKLTGGFKEGEMIVVAARPGVGKSVYATQIALAANEPTGLISLEMTSEQNVKRMLAAKSGVSFTKIRDGDLTQADIDNLILQADNMSKSDLIFDDTPSLNPSLLKAKINRMVLKHNVKTVIIDYLQLIDGDARSKKSRQQEVGEVSRAIKSLALELKIKVVVLAQLNRDSTGANSQPQIHHLRESGNIEQDADVIILLHRKEVERDQAIAAEYPTDVILGKQRNGASGVVIPSVLHGKLMQIREKQRDFS